jgi:hypothetical protein
MTQYNRIVDPKVVEESEFDEPTTKKFISKVGQKFGELTVFKFAGRDENQYLQYYCKCSCGNFVVRKAHQLTPNSLKLYSKQSCGCVINSDKKLPLVEMITRVKENTDYEIVTASELWTSKWTLRCKQHGDFVINYSSVQSGEYGCPECSTFGFNPKKAALFYVNGIYDQNGDLVAYKYGITHQILNKRLSQIIKNSNYQIENLFYFQADGYDVADFERLVKILIPSGFLKRGDLSSGFTETIHPVYIIQLAELLKNIFKEN